MSSKKKPITETINTTTETIEVERDYHVILGELEDRLEELNKYFSGKLQELASKYQPRSRYPLTNDLQNELQVEIGKIKGSCCMLNLLPNKVPAAQNECERKQRKAPELYRI